MAKKFVDWFNSPEEEANVITIGIPLGKDAKYSLSSIREVSNFVDVFDVDRKVNMLENVRIGDVGDIELKKLSDITDGVKKIVDDRKFPLVLGKSHLLSLYSLQAFPKNTKLVIFDAHGDIKNGYSDELSDESLEPLKFDENFSKKYNHTTWVRRASEIIGPENILTIGLRDCDENDFQFISEKNILYFTPSQIRKNIKLTKEKIENFVKNSNIYISLDIDAFDPSIAPAVVIAEPRGLIFSEFLDLIDSITKGNVVGLDLVEIKSMKENKITEFLAVESIFQILSRVIKK